jgi:hypothetical protein
MLLPLARTTLIADGCLVSASLLLFRIVLQDGFAAALPIQKLLLLLPELPLLGHSWSYLVPLFEQHSVSQLSMLRHCACADAHHPHCCWVTCVCGSHTLHYCLLDDDPFVWSNCSLYQSSLSLSSHGAFYFISLLLIHSTRLLAAIHCSGACFDPFASASFEPAKPAL